MTNDEAMTHLRAIPLAKLQECAARHAAEETKNDLDLQDIAEMLLDGIRPYREFSVDELAQDLIGFWLNEDDPEGLAEAVMDIEEECQ